MKNVKNLVLTGIVCSMLLLGACNDDTTDPTPGTTEKTCKITSTSDEDGTVTYTWDGDKIAKILEDSDGDIFTYNYNYVAGNLTEIVEEYDGDVITYKIVYDGDKVSRVDVSESGEVYEYYNIKWNADGTLMMVDNFDKIDNSDVLYASFEYTYNSGRLFQIKETTDADDDGDLDGDDDVYMYNLKTVDDKINPFYGIPTYLIDFTDMTALVKNNLLTASLETEGVEVPITATYEYNDDNYPTKSTVNILGENLNGTYTYVCE